MAGQGHSSFSPRGAASSVPPSPRSQEERETGAKRKRTRNLRSCAECRRSKVRCDWPDSERTRSTVGHVSSDGGKTSGADGSRKERSNGGAQGACHRCRVLGIQCLAWGGEERPRKARKSAETPVKTTRKRRSVSADRGNPDRNREAETRMEHDLQLFDPLAPPSRAPHLSSPSLSAKTGTPNDATSVAGPSSAAYMEEMTEARSGKQWPEVSILSWKPTQFMAKLCKRQKGFLRSPESDGEEDQADSDLKNKAESISASVERCCSRTQHWVSLGKRLDRYRCFLPFLPRLEEIDSPTDDVLVAVSVYLALDASSTRVEKPRQRLGAGIRRCIVDIMIRGARTFEEVAALVALAIFDPVLVSKPSATDPNHSLAVALSGSALLAAAGTAACALDMDSAPKQLKQDLSEEEQASIVMNAALWIVIVSTSALLTLADDPLRQHLFRCAEADLADFEEHCTRSTSGQHAVLRIAALRCRAHMVITQATHSSLVAVDAAQRARRPLAEMQRLFQKADDELWALLASFLSQMRQLAITLAQRQCSQQKDPHTDLGSSFVDLAMQTLELELHTAVLLAETHLMRFVTHHMKHRIEGSKSAVDFVNSLREDDEVFHLVICIGGKRSKMCRKAGILLVNLVKSAPAYSRDSGLSSFDSEGGDEDDDEEGMATLVLPPSQTCVMSNLVVKGLAEFVAGRMGTGHMPTDDARLDDPFAEADLLLVRSLGEALKTLDSQESRGKWRSQRKTRRHGDVFGASANVAERTAKVMEEWIARIKHQRIRILYAAEQQKETSTQGQETGQAVANYVSSLSQNYAHGPVANGATQQQASHLAYFPNEPTSFFDAHVQYAPSSRELDDQDTELDRFLREMLAYSEPFNLFHPS